VKTADPGACVTVNCKLSKTMIVLCCNWLRKVTINLFANSKLSINTDTSDDMNYVEMIRMEVSDVDEIHVVYYVLFLKY
jgi:hypothetical protein